MLPGVAQVVIASMMIAVIFSFVRAFGIWYR